MTAKSFPTLDVASCLTSIAMTSVKVDRMMEIASWLLGAEVYTHELVHQPTMDAVMTEGYRQFPLLPYRDQAEANWAAAARQAVAIYGETLTVEQGTHGRRESPIDTLHAVAPGKPVVVVTEKRDG